MPTNPNDTSLQGSEALQRKIADLSALQEPIRTGAGPSGAPGESFRGVAGIGLVGEVAPSPSSTTNVLTSSTIQTCKKIEPGQNGQQITLVSTANTLTVVDGENLALSANAILGADDTLTLIYLTATGKWHEIGRSNN